MLNVIDSLPMPYTSLIRTKVRGKKVRALRFLSPNTLSFACQSRLLPVIITLITFLGGCARSLFGEPDYIWNSDEIFLSFLHTKKRPLWLHVSLLIHFNQPLTINNIAALTRA